MTLIDSATAAVALGVSERTIRRLITAGKLINHGTPKRILVSLEAVASVR